MNRLPNVQAAFRGIPSMKCLTTSRPAIALESH